MIVVIADDISGAAELACLAGSHGLVAEVHTVFDASSGADVIAVDTDTRLLSAEDAAENVRTIARTVVTEGHAQWVYKKTDSLLRGNVLAETQAVAAALGKRTVLLIPANPGKGRIIRGARYLINGVPLDETPFADDPERAVTTARVDALLRCEGDAGVIVLDENQKIQTDSFNVPDVTDAKHLQDRAGEVDDTVLPAGAVEFFEALLARDAPAPKARAETSQSLSSRRLFVCGSHAAWTSSRPEQCADRGIPVVTMPHTLFGDDPSDADLDRWTAAAVEAFNDSTRVMVAIGGERSDAIDPRRLVHHLANTVEQIMQRLTIGRLFLEGGATAAAIVRHMGWRRLRVMAPVASDIVPLCVMEQSAPVLFIKPGSYPWPDGTWDI